MRFISVALMFVALSVMAQETLPVAITIPQDYLCISPTVQKRINEIMAAQQQRIAALERQLAERR